MIESHHTTLAEATPTSRRTVLRSVGLVALAGAGASALAACSSDTKTASPGAGTSATPDTKTASPDAKSASPSPVSSASKTAPAGPAPSAEGTPAGTTVAKSQVTEGSGVLVADKYVVTQPSSGEYKAFTAICTHQGCVVAGVQNKEIVCNCHGSHFSITDGSVISGPAKTALASFTLTESGSDLVITD